MKAFSFFAFCTLLSLSLSNAHASSIVGSWEPTDTYCESAPSDTLERKSLMTLTSTTTISTEFSDATLVFDDQMNFAVSAQMGEDFADFLILFGVPTQKTKEELAACALQINMTYATNGNQLTFSAPNTIEDILQSPNCSAEVSVMVDRIKALGQSSAESAMSLDLPSDTTVEFEVSTDGQTLTFANEDTGGSCGANERVITEFTRINN